MDRDSPINHANVAKTCGKCHVGIEATYDKSVHGQLLAKGDPRGPVCIDCHSAHEIVNPTGNNFKAISDERCGKCHADRLAGLPGHLSRQGHAARQTQFRAGRRRVLRLPRLPRHPAAVQSAVASFKNQHPRHLPAMSSGRDAQIHRISAAREPAGREELSAAARGVPGDDRPAHRHVRVFRPAHARRGWCARFTFICTTQKNSARRKSRRRRTANGSRASCRSSGSCISWSCRASCCSSSPACR